MRMVGWLVLVVLGVTAGCGEPDPPPIETVVLGAWRLEPVSTLTAFSLAAREHREQTLARMAEDPETHGRATPQTLSHLRSDARDWALAYAYAFRLQIEADGTASVVIPTMREAVGEVGTVALELRWRVDDGALQIWREGAGQDVGVEAGIVRDGSRLALTDWRVVIPHSRARGRYGVYIDIEAPLVRP